MYNAEMGTTMLVCLPGNYNAGQTIASACIKNCFRFWYRGPFHMILCYHGAII